ncbi:hypothetical protein B0H13DRAFT_1592378, partial [Mycena leptocephala]
ITKLKYEGKLPRSVTGLYRRRLLRSYAAWKTDHRDPPHFHPAMKWNKTMGPRIPDAVITVNGDQQSRGKINGKSQKYRPHRMLRSSV